MRWNQPEPGRPDGYTFRDDEEIRQEAWTRYHHDALFHARVTQVQRMRTESYPGPRHPAVELIAVGLLMADIHPVTGRYERRPVEVPKYDEPIRFHDFLGKPKPSWLY